MSLFKTDKIYFFGWTNIKWVIKEFVKMYSHQPSFFSYKRFQVGTAFLTFQIGSRYALYNHVHNIEQFLMWASAELLICGFTLKAIQTEKSEIRNEQPNQ